MAGLGDDDTLSLGESATGEVALAPDTKLGRFVLVGALGSGGMGVVLSGYDPELDRKVAIKVLRTDAWGGAVEEGRVRLAREAQAMARLSHPNVVAVHEVGTFGASLFVVMELVEGQTLNAWLHERPRVWAELRAKFLAAGRGLEAAHHAGLVHRDFKPSNVLVGKDGRARITDFGLASVRAQAALAQTMETSHTGMAGTPAYMAPEQLCGQIDAVDARADQFSFCVSLYEALYGERPFSGATLEEARAATAIAPRPPPRKNVPAWLSAIVVRGLARDPAQRWPDMGALLAALERDPDVARRRRITRLSVAGLALLGGVALWRVERSRHAQCDRAGARLASVWDGGARDRLRHAFEASGSVLAADAFARVSGALDGYTRGLIGMSEESCRANRVEGRQSDTLYDLRMGCLEQRGRGLQVLLSQWSSGMSRTAVEQAQRAVADLPSADECADVAALTAITPLPRDAAARNEIAAVRALLDRSRASDAAADFKPALTAAHEADAQAARIEWPEIQAEAQLQLAIVGGKNNDQATNARLQAATRLATQAHDDNLAAHAFVEQVKRQALRNDESPLETLARADAAEAFIARAANRDILRGRLLVVRGLAYSHLGRYADAERAYLQARKLLAVEGPQHYDNVMLLDWLSSLDMQWGHLDDAEKWGQQALSAQIAVSGPNHPGLVETLNDLSNVYGERGEYARAREFLLRALALDEKNYGNEGPHRGGLLGNLGNAAFLDGRLAEGAELCKSALKIDEREGGTEAVNAYPDLLNLASIRREQGFLDEAEADHRRLLAYSEKHFGPTDFSLVSRVNELALTLQARHDFDGAEAGFERAYQLGLKAFGAESTNALSTRALEAHLERERGRCPEAIRLYAELLPRMENTFGPEHPQVARVLSGMGRCALSQGHPDAAVAPLERALAIDEKKQVQSGETGTARFALARAERVLGKADPARAQAERAERELAASESASAKRELTALRAWRRR